jgi:hypothetical protein
MSEPIFTARRLAVLGVVAFGALADVLPAAYQPLCIFGICAAGLLWGAGTVGLLR